MNIRNLFLVSLLSCAGVYAMEMETAREGKMDLKRLRELLQCNNVNMIRAAKAQIKYLLWNAAYSGCIENDEFAIYVEALAEVAPSEVFVENIKEAPQVLLRAFFRNSELREKLSKTPLSIECVLDKVLNCDSSLADSNYFLFGGAQHQRANAIDELAVNGKNFHAQYQDKIIQFIEHTAGSGIGLFWTLDSTYVKFLKSPVPEIREKAVHALFKHLNPRTVWDKDMQDAFLSLSGEQYTILSQKLLQSHVIPVWKR